MFVQVYELVEIDVESRSAANRLIIDDIEPQLCYLNPFYVQKITVRPKIKGSMFLKNSRGSDKLVPGQLVHRDGLPLVTMRDGVMHAIANLSAAELANMLDGVAQQYKGQVLPPAP